MLHELKVAIVGKGDKTLLKQHEHLKVMDEKISKLLRWFPQLQSRVEDNEDSWSHLALNIRSFANIARDICHSENPLTGAIDSLYRAGESLQRPNDTHYLACAYSKSFTDLRMFNESIRKLRFQLDDCMMTLKNKDYYETKVETMLNNESKKRRVSDKEIERRIRNEQKLTEAAGELAFKTDKLQKDLTTVLDKKDFVLKAMATSFIEMQNYYLLNNSLSSVFQALPVSQARSPVYISHGSFDESSKDHSHEASTPPDCKTEPPRAPSPDRIMSITSGPTRTDAATQCKGHI